MTLIRRYKKGLIITLLALYALSVVRMIPPGRIVKFLLDGILRFFNLSDLFPGGANVILSNMAPVREGFFRADLPTFLFPVYCVLGIVVFGHIPSEKFLDRRARLIRLRENKHVREEYCEWLNNQTADFIRLLEKRNFCATWGFQLMQANLYGKPCGDICVFDLPDLEIVAVDENSRQLLYCTYTGLPYKKYLEGDRIPDYQYTLIPMSKVSYAEITSEEYTMPVERTVWESTPWHGVAWTSDGFTPVFGASLKHHTEKENQFVGSKTVFKIHTSVPEHEEILLTVRERTVVRRIGGRKVTVIESDKDLLLDARCGMIGRKFPFIRMEERPADRKESDFDTRIKPFRAKTATVLDTRYSYVFRTGDWINIDFGNNPMFRQHLIDKKVDSLLPEGTYVGCSRKYNRSGRELAIEDLLLNGPGIYSWLDDNAKYINALRDKIRCEEREERQRQREEEQERQRLERVKELEEWILTPWVEEEEPIPQDEGIPFLLETDESDEPYLPAEDVSGISLDKPDVESDSPIESDDGVITVELQMDTTNKARAIIELAKLKREGLITKDEFDKLKNELMEQDS